MVYPNGVEDAEPDRVLVGAPDVGDFVGVDDDFLDPLNFRPESMLGVPGIMDVYRAGGVTIANAPGTGIADDKAIYSYMGEIVEFYTGETAILKAGDCAYVPPGVEHGAVCKEAGVLLDIFSPAREDFLEG